MREKIQNISNLSYVLLFLLFHLSHKNKNKCHSLTDSLALHENDKLEFEMEFRKSGSSKALCEFGIDSASSKV